MTGSRLNRLCRGLEKLHEEHPWRFWGALAAALAFMLTSEQLLLGPGIVHAYHHPPQLADRRVAQYLLEAGEMAVREGYPTYWRPPGHVLLLAGWSWAFGSSSLAIVGLFGTYLTVTVVGALAMAHIASLIGGGALGAAATAVLIGSSPVLARFVGAFVGDIPAASLHWLWLYSLFRAHDSAKWRRHWLAAATLAIAAGSSFRPLAYAFVPLLALALAIPILKRHRAFVARAALATTLGLAATTLPWCARNYQRCGHFTPYAFTYVTLRQGSTWTERGLWHGPGSTRFLRRYDQALNTGPPRCFESEVEAQYKREFFELLRSQAVWKTGTLWVANAARTWFGLDVGTGGGGSSSRWYPMLIVHHLVLLGGAAMALHRRWVTASAPLGLAAGFSVYLMALHSVAAAEPRYSLPMMPLLAAIAGVGLSRYLRERSGQTGRVVPA